LGNAELIDMLDLALQRLELLAFAGGQTFAQAVVNFIALDPVVERLRHSTYLARYRFNGRP